MRGLLLVVVVGCSGSSKQPAVAPTPTEVAPPLKPAPSEPPAPQPEPPQPVVADPPHEPFSNRDLEGQRPPSGRHESQADIAARLNEEGKQAMFAKQFEEASSRFRNAVARVPEPGYFYNLCASLYQEGKFVEALTACHAVENAEPTPKQRAKAQNLRAKILDEARRQGIELRAD